MADLKDELKRLVDSTVFDDHRAAMMATIREGWSFGGETTATLQVSLLARIFGKKSEVPKLPAHVSKQGGVPYLETASDWPLDENGQLPFVAQINFAELPPIASPAPDEGIFVLFATRDLSYRWVWYPTPTGEAVLVSGPCVAKTESTLVGIVETSLSCASWWDPDAEDIADEFDELTALCNWQGTTLGGWTNATLPGLVRQWSGMKPNSDEEWLSVWTQAQERVFGSIIPCVVVRVADFEAGRLDRCAVVKWQ